MVRSVAAPLQGRCDSISFNSIKANKFDFFSLIHHTLVRASELHIKMNYMGLIPIVVEGLYLATKLRAHLMVRNFL